MFLYSSKKYKRERKRTQQSLSKYGPLELWMVFQHCRKIPEISLAADVSLTLSDSADKLRMSSVSAGVTCLKDNTHVGAAVARPPFYPLPHFFNTS